MTSKYDDLTYHPGDIIQASDFKLMNDSMNITEKLRELEQRIEELEEKLTTHGSD